MRICFISNAHNYAEFIKGINGAERHSTTSDRGLTSVGSEALNMVEVPKSPPATVSMLNAVHEGLSKEAKK
jgi:hypothetical protein